MQRKYKFDYQLIIPQPDCEVTPFLGEAEGFVPLPVEKGLYRQ